MTVYALKDIGVQTVHCPVTVKMEHHVLQMKESVSVHLVTGVLLVKEVSFPFLVYYDYNTNIYGKGRGYCLRTN